MKKVFVIGGGPAGMMAAYAAAKNGHHVTLIEKNEKLGKKIYITGKGRCNFTNDSPVEEFLQNIVRGERFLKGSLYSLSPQNVIDFFEEYGLSVKTERGNRVFPSSDHASDVTKTLEKACKSVGVAIHLNETLKNINTMSDIIPMCDITDKSMSNIIPMTRIVGISTDRETYECDVLIVATGGVSYPTTGSTGDGYRFAREFGHKIVEIKPALCGLNTPDERLRKLQGVSLKNVSLTAKIGEKQIFSGFGEMLFTHFGISGPLVLSLSSKVNRLSLKDVRLSLDLKPALDDATLDRRILRDFEKYKNKQIANALCELLPQKLIGVVLSFANIAPTKNVNVLTKEERGRLVNVLKNLPIKIQSLRGIEEAIVTSGGVELSEINPKTMESKKVKGLKFCGEVLDVDAFTGGFNMQIAFSTGFAAGNSVIDE
jgi:predicted Rossmann fold flavoprotein